MSDFLTTSLEFFVALCAFAIVRRLSGDVWGASLKWFLQRSQRLRMIAAASIASDKELAMWVGREEDDIEVAR